MQLERALIVVEKRDSEDGRHAAFDLWHMRGSLMCSGLAKNIDVLYYSEYENFDEKLINYCLTEKPQVILLSLQDMVTKGGGASREALSKITTELKIPTVMFWWSIYVDSMADLLESYSGSVSLNIIGGADSSSHKPIDAGNHIYCGTTYDERLFGDDLPRDIPVGFLGSLVPFRRAWLDEIIKAGFKVYTAGGQLVDGDSSFSTGKAPPLWLPYEEYLKLTARMKIILNFSTGLGPTVLSIDSAGGRAERKIGRFVTYVRKGLPAFIKSPSRWIHAFSSLKNATSAATEIRREMTRSRVWEALWSRTFLLEEFNPITAVYLEPDVDYVPFFNLKDLLDKIKYYLENDEERDKIRLQGRATVEKYYNVRNYWDNIFEAAGAVPESGFRHQPGEIWNKEHFNKWLSKAGTIYSVNR